MAEKKLRVHTLAKELDVPSKVIVDKCQAEGIDVKNHMHIVSAGLEATIREWFSEGAHLTTLEEADRVDLKKIRKRAPRKAKAAAAASDAAGDSGVAVMEAPAEPAAAPAPPVVRKRAKPEPPPADEAPASPEQTGAAAVVEHPPADAVVEVSPPVAAPTPPETAVESPAEPPDARAAAARVEPPAAATEPPAKPTPAKPPTAGPQNVPKPAKLTGPRVVRMDRPEAVERPTPRPRTAGRAGTGPPGRTGAPPGRDAEGAPARRAPGRGPVREGRDTETAEKAAERQRAHPRRAVRDTGNVAFEHLREWRDRDLIERRDRLAHASGRGIGGLRAIEGKQPSRRPSQRSTTVRARKAAVELTEPIIIKDLSREAGIPVADILRRLIQDHGQMATINSALETEMAQLLASEYGIELTVVQARTGLDRLAEEFAAIERRHLAARPPVVTVLGHVDHGKTSLLDRIRKANVAAGEHGGITQHIGAYRVQVGDKWVTFLDTPGHTAFTAMRARGTVMTDVVVLVVAADDGVMPTTIEAINHARAADTPIVVALNKIDLPHDINKIYGQLAEHGLTPSGDWGGDTDVIKTSATSGQGVQDLLVHLATLSEVMDLKADPTIPACGTVIESEMKEGAGAMARLLVQEGRLNQGDIAVCGAVYGRIRSMTDDTGRTVKKAGPAVPVEVAGLSGVPEAGDRFYVVDNLQRASQIADEIAVQRREKALARAALPTSLESVLASAAEGLTPELQVIVKADVQGSVDVLRKVLSEFPSDQVKLNILHSGVGAVTESDVVLAQASEAVIVAFHVVPEPAVQRLADQAGVSIRSYQVIYNLLDDIKKALEDQLPPDEKIESRGRAEVREVFSISRVGKVAGCLVRDGSIMRSHTARLLRDSVVLKERLDIGSLRRFKDDVREVKAGLECGIALAGFDDVKPGDVIETYEVVKVARTLGGA